MTFAAIMAALIRAVLARASLRSHERVLLHAYDELTSQQIASYLLEQECVTATLAVPEDTGDVSEVSQPATALVPSKSSRLSS